MIEAPLGAWTCRRLYATYMVMVDEWESFFSRRLGRFQLRKRQPKRRGRGQGGEPVEPLPRGPLPRLSGGAAVAIEDEQPDR